jgi:hypothetical protein
MSSPADRVASPAGRTGGIAGGAAATARTGIELK